MRLIGAVSVLLSVVLTLTIAGSGARVPADGHGNGSKPDREQLGRTIFRFDTFGNEQLWTDVLRMHEAAAELPPQDALGAGLKVDADALPRAVVDAIGAGAVDLTDPALTIELLRLDAVVGLRGRVDAAGQLTSLGVTCALCHSTVDDRVAPGIGRRLDGWANTDLNVGVIVSLSPALDAATRDEFARWGPGKYDPRHHAFDGLNIVPLNTPSLPIVIPPIYGLQRVGWETYTGDGPISYWNSYVGVTQMGGQGIFFDPRLPLRVVQTPDRVTPKLRPLLDYQLSLHAPEPRPGTVDRRAARRGARLFHGKARCSTCHMGPAYTDVRRRGGRFGPFLHDPEDTGMDPRYAARSATGKYRTTPLRALWQHPPYFHDGSAPDLAAVVEHYKRVLGLTLSDREARDLVEFLESL